MDTLFSRDTAVKVTKLAIAIAAGGAVYLWADSQDGSKKK